MTKCLYTVLLFVLAFTYGNSQTNNGISLEVAHSDDFKTYRSYPAMCVSDVHEDQSGKLWLQSCGSAVQLSAHLFGFDGYAYSLVPGKLSKIGNAARICGVINDTLYGFHAEKNMNLFFRMNLEDQHFLYYDSLPFNQETEMVVANNKAYYFFLNDHNLTFKELYGNRLSTSEIDLKADFGLEDPGLNLIRFAYDHLWIFDPLKNKFYTINLSNDFKSEIDLSPYLKDKQFTPKEISKVDFTFTDEMLHFSYYKSNSWHLNTFQLILNQQVSLVERFTIKSEEYVHAFSDKNSNLLCIYQEDSKIQAFIELKGGIRVDASELFNTLWIKQLRNVVAEDFLKELYLCTESGFSVVKVKLKDAIHSIAIPRSLRSLNELNKNQLLINTQGRDQYIYDINSDQYFDSDQSICIPSTQVTRWKNQTIWTPSNDYFIGYNPISSECDSFFINDFKTKIFDFINDESIIGSSVKNGIYIFDIKEKSRSPVNDLNTNFDHETVVHDIFVDSKDRIWIVKSEGLFRVDPNSKKMENVTAAIDGFDFKLLSICEADDGNLFLGTSLSGLILLNPDTKEFTQTSSEEGLCNNTVVSITKDHNGMYWVGTYNGIALVNQEGELITNFYEKDGLASNECNRYSATTLSNGNVAIGSIQGLTILNPDLILQSIHDKNEVKIYLTEAIYLEGEETMPTDHKSKIHQNTKIELLPESRNLSLKFAVSNYVRPLENRYSYKIDAFHDDWVELGNSNTLELRDLPPGKYKLEIRGGDNLGNWSEDNLLLEIHAKQFFYKSGWFYFVILSFITSIVLLWITSLRRQVKTATKMITEDKEIIESQAEKLKELDKAKSEFFTNISHEFRTPLTIISGMADQIIAKPDTWLEKGAKMIKENTINLLNLVNQILDLRKLESKNLSVQLVQGDIVSYIKYLVNSHRHLAIQNQIGISFASSKPELVMDYDPEKILRIISNLLSNAIKFNITGGKVNVGMSVLGSDQNQKVQISIQDTGLGIPKADLAGIFDRFYRADADQKPNTIGTGIGLALTRQLVELLGGTIDVDSVLNSGSVFTVTLPISTDSELKAINTPVIQDDVTLEKLEMDVKEHPSDEVILMTEKREGLPNLLIVEDNASIITMISAQLEDDYNITYKLDGQQGIDAALAETPDIIISDIMMPVKDGIQLCKELKSDEKTSHIPIVLLTAKTGQEIKLLSLEHRADVFLSKPFDPQELKLQMSNLLEIRKSLQSRRKTLDKETPKAELTKEDAFVLKLRSAIEENLGDDSFGVLQLQRAVGLSRSHLHNKIKALTGLSTTNYIRMVRLQEAKKMFEANTDLNVSEVAYAVGFSNPNYFSSSYTKEFGVNPSQARE